MYKELDSKENYRRAGVRRPKSTPDWGFADVPNAREFYAPERRLGN